MQNRAFTLALSVAVGMALIALMAGCGGGGGGGGGGGTTFEITNAFVTPTAFPTSDGGTASIEAQVTATGTDVASVVATVTKPGGGTQNVTMTKAPGTANIYDGTFVAAANTTGGAQSQVYSVVIKATSTGGQTVQSSTLTFSVPGLESPPPPPG